MEEIIKKLKKHIEEVQILIENLEMGVCLNKEDETLLDTILFRNKEEK